MADADEMLKKPEQQARCACPKEAADTGAEVELYTLI